MVKYFFSITYVASTSICNCTGCKSMVMVSDQHQNQYCIVWNTVLTLPYSYMNYNIPLIVLVYIISQIVQAHIIAVQPEVLTAKLTHAMKYCISLCVVQVLLSKFLKCQVKRKQKLLQDWDLKCTINTKECLLLPGVCCISVVCGGLGVFFIQRLEMDCLASLAKA